MNHSLTLDNLKELKGFCEIANQEIQDETASERNDIQGSIAHR